MEMTIFNPPNLEPIIEPVAIVWAVIFGVVLGIIVLRVLLHPLRINGNLVSLAFECVLGVLCIVALVSGLDQALGALSLIFYIISYLSSAAAALVLFPLALLTIVLTSGQRPEPQGTEAPSATPSQSQFSLGELVGMVASFGFSPLVINLVAHQGSIVSTFLIALMVFPLLFWRAFSRLDANKVSIGFPRLGFLCTYPYMVCGCLYVSTTCFFIIRKGVNPAQTWAPEWSAAGLSVSVIGVIMGTTFAWLAKGESSPPVDPYRPNLFKTR